MQNLLPIAHLILGIALVILILIQPRGKGLGRGVSSNSFSRRGLEKLIFRMTFIVAFLFIVISIIRLFV